MWIAPGRWPRSHSWSSRTSTSTWCVPFMIPCAYSATVICLTRDLASSASLRKPSLCFTASARGRDRSLLVRAHDAVERVALHRDLARLADGVDHRVLRQADRAPRESRVRDLLLADRAVHVARAEVERDARGVLPQHHPVAL